MVVNLINIRFLSMVRSSWESKEVGCVVIVFKVFLIFFIRKFIVFNLKNIGVE